MDKVIEVKFIGSTEEYDLNDFIEQVVQDEQVGLNEASRLLVEDEIVVNEDQPQFIQVFSAINKDKLREQITALRAEIEA